MRKVVYTTYGSPDVLEIHEVDLPVPAVDQVRLRVVAAVVEATDAIFRRGDQWAARLATGLFRPRQQVLGFQLSGVVDAVGAAVTRFKPGDAVFGSSGAISGTHAEYVCLPEGAALVHKPATIPHAEAVAVCDGVLTALPFLRDLAGLRAGQSLLINGAAGGIGTAAVQLARHFGARVTGVCGPSSVELVRSLGADRVIDYSREDFTRGGPYAVIFDAVGKSSFRRCAGALEPGGIYMTTVPSLAIAWQALWTSRFGKRRAAISFTGMRSPAERTRDLELARDLMQRGELRAVIDTRYPLSRIADAHRLVDSGHKKGSVVVEIGAE